MRSYIISCSVYSDSDFYEINNYLFPSELEELHIALHLADKVSFNGGDIFSFTVFSEDYVIQRAINDEEEPWDRMGCKILPKITKEAILEYINDCLDKCEGETWEEIATKLMKYFYYEFDGMYGFDSNSIIKK